MSSVLLDTNAFSRLMAGDRNVAEALSAADIVYLSVIVLGELRAGFKAGTRESENLALLARFSAKPTVKVLSATPDTAEMFAHVKDLLRKAGRPIPVNDIWIAAHAFETGSALITFDGHFAQVPGLRLWRHFAP